MPPLERDHAATLALLHDLDSAIAAHAAWLARFNRQLICRESAASDDLAVDAHLHCRFGAWFYREGQADLASETSLAAIEATHRAVHDIARHLLVTQAAGEAIHGDDYDAFTAITARFRQLLRRLEQDLMERLGAVDNLTGVWNRQAVSVRLAEEIERAQRSRQPCSICYADLDGYAHINDEYGHKVGDALLKAVAAWFAGQLRGYDTLFRIGGEEFLICLPNTDIPQAALLIDRLRIGLSTHEFNVDDRAIRLTASFGVVSLEPIFFIDETLERAQRAQLIARAEGGNQVCVWKDAWGE